MTPLVQCCDKTSLSPNFVALSLLQHDVICCSPFQISGNETTVVEDVQHLMSLNLK